MRKITIEIKQPTNFMAPVISAFRNELYMNDSHRRDEKSYKAAFRGKFIFAKCKIAFENAAASVCVRYVIYFPKESHGCHLGSGFEHLNPGCRSLIKDVSNRNIFIKF